MMCVEYFFPKDPVVNDMPQSMKMRSGIVPLLLGHAVCGVVGMAFVSVATFIAQFIYIILLYSIYMTLRTWMVWVYIILIGFNALSGFLNVWIYDGARFWSYLLIIAYYVLAIYKIYYDSLPFRTIGDREEGNNFYFEAGIRHIVNNAREQYLAGNQNNN
jgi:hypothetical protein